MNTDHWQNGTNALRLQYLVEVSKKFDEYPEDKYECVQMFYTRSHKYAEQGYTQYIHEWPVDKLPKNYKLSEVVDLLRDYFVGCEITYTENHSTTVSNTCETYKLESCVIVVDWTPNEDEEEDYDKKQSYREYLEKHYDRKYGF